MLGCKKTIGHHHTTIMVSSLFSRNAKQGFDKWSGKVVDEDSSPVFQPDHWIFTFSYGHLLVATWKTVSMQNFSHFMKNNVFSNNAFFGGQLHKNYVFMFSHNFEGFASCIRRPGFIVQGNVGWRGICHVWTWLSSINGPWDSCCSKPVQNNGGNLRRNDGNQRNNGRNFRKIPATKFGL